MSHTRALVPLLLVLPTLPAHSAVPPPSIVTFRASTFAKSAQYESALAELADGDLVAVWTSRKQQGGNPGIYAQRFDQDGVALGSETQVNLWTPSAQNAPAIAALPDGGAVVVWRSFGQDGDAGAIVARRFTDDRSAARTWRGADETLVNEITRGDQASPVVTTDAAGDVLFAWLGERADGRHAMHLRAWRADGSWSDERVITAEDPARCPSLAVLPNGLAALTWTADAADGSTRLERAVVDPASAAILGCETIVDDAYEAALAPTADGALLAWNALSSEAQAVRAQRLDAFACPIATALELGEGFAPAPVALGDGANAVAWTRRASDATGEAHRRIVLQRLDDDVAAHELTAALPGDQALRVASGAVRVIGSSGRVALVWDGDAGLGDDLAVHVTLVSSAPFAEPAAARGIDPKTMAAASAPADQGASPHIPPRFDPASADHGRRTISVNDSGIGFDAIIDTGWTPPDCHLAVGASHVIAATNGRISFFDKAGTQLFTDELEGANGFFGPVGATDFVFDPECLYDILHDRYWIMASEGFTPNGHSYVLLAVSDDGNPVGTWFKYRFDVTTLAGSVLDSPNISVDSQAVYVTGDGNVGNYQIFIWDVASILAGAAPAISKSLVYTTPVQSAGIAPVQDASANALYMLEHKEAASNTKVKFIALRNPLTTPTLSTTEITVPTYGPPEDAPQKGTGVVIENFEARFWSCDYHDGSFWATHHINSARVLVRWYQFKMNGWPTSGNLPTLAQNGTIDPGPGIRTYLSAIGADSAGNACLTFARSSPNEYISMCTALRRSGDPLGTFQAPVIIKTNTGPYTEAGRWGDYGAARRDPAPSPGFAARFWANHEYAIGASTWRTWAQELVLPLLSPDINNDGIVDATDLALLLGAWGAPSPTADLNGDGIVGPEDLAILLGAWS